MHAMRPKVSGADFIRCIFENVSQDRIQILAGNKTAFNSSASFEHVVCVCSGTMTCALRQSAANGVNSCRGSARKKLVYAAPHHVHVAVRDCCNYE